MQVDFYHLTGQPLDHVLPRIAQRVLAGGGRLLIVAAEAEERARIDRLLWTWEPESFLPHGQSGPGEAEQPVLLAEGVSPANGARNVALIDGEWRDAALDFDRAFHLFDEASIGAARRAWKALAERTDVERRYLEAGRGWPLAAGSVTSRLASHRPAD